MAQTSQPDDECKSDMTPMIDVVFLLIVFFLCIDFKVLEAKLDAWLPTDKGITNDIVTPEEQLVVRVHVATAGVAVYGDGSNEATLDAATQRPARFRLDGHSVRYEVGAHSCATLHEAQHELTRIANDASSMIPAKDGGRKLITCVVEGYPGTRYDDVARTADVCHAAGFVDIQFGGGIDEHPRGR
jgi:hypothetical protein